jgi:hypothetical protein
VAIRKSQPVFFSPKGASDAIDNTNVFDGACSNLSNLIPDTTTKDIWTCRPASILKTSFSGFTTPGFVSTLFIVGNIAYGMIASARFAGHDEPFSYNILSNTFNTITGVTAANTPTSPATTGAWNPPTMALIGAKIIVTHPGFNFAGGFAFGVLDTTTPTAPTWTAQNTATNALPALPSWVENFNQRAWFLVNIPNGQPGAYFTKSLDPLTIVNATDVITFDDNAQLTVAAGLALFNQLGGIIQSLMVFKGAANVYQITGDSATTNLSRNSLNVATGTLSPLSVTNTPRGLTFMAPDGLRIIDFTARISDPIGVDGEGINAPFIASVVPTRVQAASNQNVLRISVQNGIAPGSPTQEFWYDISRKKWSGPHTFPASMISAYNNTFLMTPITPSTSVPITGSLWQSDVTQSSTSTFVENGSQMTFNLTTGVLPDQKQMSEMCVVESTINLRLGPGQVVGATALDQNMTVLNSVILMGAGAPTLWDQFQWGQALWGGPQNALSHYPLNWTLPLVFSRLQLQFTGNSTPGFKIGDLFLRYQKLGYLQRFAGAA